MVKERSTSGYKVEVSSGNHIWLADEPMGVGDNAGPNPYELLLSALAACTLMSGQMYASRKGWPLEGVSIELFQQHIHAGDCTDCETQGRARINEITGHIILEGGMDVEQKARLMEIENRCPIHRTLKMETNIRLSGE